MSKPRSSTPKPMPRLAMYADLGVIHRSSTLRPALEQIPDWAETRDRMLLLDQAAPPRANTGTVTENIEALISGGLAAGKVPDDLAERAAAVKAQVELAEQVQTAIERTRERLTNDLDTAVRFHTSGLYTSLNDQLQAVVDDVRALGDVRDLVDAESAIAADRVQDWQRLGELDRRHAEIRQAQSQLMRLVDSAEPQYAEVTLMRNPAEAFGFWSAWRRYGYLINSTGQHKRLEAPWPEDGRSLEFLLWAVDADAELWVPTETQLAEASRELHEIATGNAQPARRRKQESPAPPAEFVDPATLRGATMPARRLRSTA